ncbi:MAG: FeoC-like transcriptional regulator [Cohaesibacter sp.]|jgi:hypothetical protein|nr:FeoC-like transcriptional regulator [Cohaesibacter sp.]
MILRDLMSYITMRKRVSLEEIALHFAADPLAIRGMLEKLETKGKVRSLPVAECSSNCCLCDIDKCAPSIWEPVPKA